MSPGALQTRLRFWLRARRYRRSRDPAEIEAMLSWLRPGEVALDIGAHKGGYLYWMRRAVGPGGRVFGFEPQPEAAKTLERLAAVSRWDNVVIEQLALSDQSGEANLFLPGGGEEISSGATIEPRQAGASTGRTTTCRTESLDEWASRRGLDRVDFVKCDVEGHELAVLRGGRETFGRWRPTLLVECETRHAGPRATARLFEELGGLGYHGSFFYRGVTTAIEEFDPDRHQRLEDYLAGRLEIYANNFLFVHPERESAAIGARGELRR